MVFLLITMLLDIGTPTATNGLELTNEKKLVLTDAMYAGQGITTDGEYYYTAGSMTGFNSNGLAKWDIATFDKVLVNYGAEDLTVYPFEDGSLIHVVDYDKTVATYIRDYKIVE